MRHIAALVFVSLFLLQDPVAFRSDPPAECSECEKWNQPTEPFQLFGNAYYVGVAGISAILVTSDAGHILLDGALPQSAAIIDANVRKLGFKTSDIRLILNSHAHFDHAGGIHALQRASGAIVATSAAGARALQQGRPTPDDPQTDTLPYPAIDNVRTVADGEVLRVGPLAITAHWTPGHTPGSTTWTWRSCDVARCLDMVYADSLTAVSDDGFRFSGGGGRPSVVETFRQSIDKIAQLPCDIIVSTHPSAVGLDAKRARKREAPETNPFIDPDGCRTYAAAARKRLDERIRTEAGQF